MARSNARKTGSPGSPTATARRRAEKERRRRQRRRRRVLAAIAAVVAVLAAGGGLIFALQQGEREARDLSGIGQGIPVVVQVHDATCPVCTELRENVESIEDEFADDELLIRVADVHTDEGLAFAARYTTARRATLLFLDGEGDLVEVEKGAQSPDALQRRFQQHAAGQL
ncbi:MAG: hypothetical protein ACLFUX_10300 [Spirochaetaceae bacterium]